MLQTLQDVTITFKHYGKLTIPKGTRITHQTAMGYDENYNFVDDFSWIKPYSNGVKQYGLLHDATYIGINIDKKYVGDL